MKNLHKPLIRFAVLAFLMSCNGPSGQSDPGADRTQIQSSLETNQPGSFAYDLEFLKRKDTSLIVLSSADKASQIIVSPKYQAKVFTSTADGQGGKSFGWVNYKAFDGPEDGHMNAYGGEDRLWLGPEGGPYSLYFHPGAKMEFEHWKTPAAIDTEAWTLLASDVVSASLTKKMHLQNYAGTRFDIQADRKVILLDQEGINAALGLRVHQDVKSVAFRTVNSLTNRGQLAWDEKTGAPCMWNLDMFMPSEACTIVIPYEVKGSGKVATTDYFGEIDKDRIHFKDGILFFRADGKSRGKLGIPPGRVKNVAGSYDAIDQVLTIVKFDIQPNGKYLNQEWRTDRPPYSGDAMNAYNDGPLADGKQMGPFYEIESVSPAAFLKPGEQLTHHHSVFHFTGDPTTLNEMATQLLGVSIEQITQAFKK